MAAGRGEGAGVGCVTLDELARMLAQYSAGIEAELQLLNELADISKEQHNVSASGDLAAFERVADTRDRITAGLVTIEDDLRGIRKQLTDHRDLAMQIPSFEAVAARHRQAAQLVNDILLTDQQSMAALADAELSRRSAVASLERGETTLAAYRRVLSPPVASAKLVDTRG
jgi:hypothetical protein